MYLATLCPIAKSPHHLDDVNFKSDGRKMFQRVVSICLSLVCGPSLRLPLHSNRLPRRAIDLTITSLHHLPHLLCNGMPTSLPLRARSLSVDSERRRLLRPILGGSFCSTREYRSIPLASAPLVRALFLDAVSGGMFVGLVAG